MTDPFLAAHEIAPSCFDLGGRFQPASIRDQTLRAYLIVQRLADCGRLRRHSRILIVGAGAAGVAAGIQAVRRGAMATIVEKGDKPFLLQRDAEPRWIDPTQYDWPLNHWRRGKFPSSDCDGFPLRWEAGFADAVVEEWGEQLDEALAIYGGSAKVDSENGRLKVHYSTSCECLLDPGFRGFGGQIEALLKSNGAEQVQSFDFAIFCQGFGKENTTVAGYTGPPFWSGNHPGWGERKSTLIVGGGDGALQDFLLMTTGRHSARELYEAIFPGHLGQLIEGEIQSAEDQAHRAGLWSATPMHDHAALMRLEQAHQQIAAQALADSSSARSELNHLFPDGRVRVAIAHSCEHFSRAYALNRFLAILITHFLDDSRRCPRISGMAATMIRSATKEHRCNPKEPDACYDYPHEVTLCPAGCSPVTGVQRRDRFERIVIRAGIEAPPGIVVEVAPGEYISLWRFLPRRQSLPYDPV